MLDINEIFNIKNEQNFNDICLKIFKYQYNNIEVYKKYVDLLRIDVNKIEHYSKIPFLPIEFFKKYRIISQQKNHELHFKSSGTTSSERSNHFILDRNIYELSSQLMFESFFGNINDYIFIGLLPSYIQNGDSSLVYMVNHFMNKSKKQENGFYLDDFKSLYNLLLNIENQNKKAVLFGVSYALLDFAEMFPLKLNHVNIIETGGMKGKRKEVTKLELINKLKNSFKTENIFSEYGMTELLSQSYSDFNLKYKSPNWKKILIRSIDDPFTLITNNNKVGAINIIDLANVNSCSFIETQDLGKLHIFNEFEIVGRIDNSDIRGCNLLYN